MNDSKRIWVWVGAAVVVVVVVVAIFWRPVFSPQQSSSSKPTPVVAPQGQLTPKFPQGLILDPQAQVESSYSINYSSSTNQYTAQWNSSSSLASLYGKYKTYLNGNSFTVVNASGGTSASSLAIIYAVSVHATVNVAIVPQGKGSKVTISYVAH